MEKVDETLFRNIFRALEYRNYRLFFIGQCVSLVGTWIQQVAISWLAYRLTNSALMLGIVGFVSQIPIFIFSPFAGVLTDRYNCQKILIFTQVLAMVQALILAFLTLTGIVNVSHILLLGFFLGCITSLDTPARHSFLIHMVEHKEILGNAIALNSVVFNSTRLIGPSIAGILIASVGEGMCFLLNGISFFAVIWCLFLMKIKPQKIKQYPRILHSLKEGFVYVFGFLPIRFILLLLGFISLMGMSCSVLMPVFAKDILHGGPQTLGFLMAAVGIGALGGTVYLAAQKKIFRLDGMLSVASGIFGAGLILFSLSKSIWISLVMLLFIGFGFMVHMAISNTVLQTIVEDDKRGRVMSFYTMAFMGMTPLGSLLAGGLANKLGAVSALMISGVLCIVASLLFASKIRLIREIIHPIYKKIEIIPDVDAVVVDPKQG